MNLGLLHLSDELTLIIMKCFSLSLVIFLEVYFDNMATSLFMVGICIIIFFSILLLSTSLSPYI